MYNLQQRNAHDTANQITLHKAVACFPVCLLSQPLYDLPGGRSRTQKQQYRQHQNTARIIFIQQTPQPVRIFPKETFPAHTLDIRGRQHILDSPAKRCKRRPQDDRGMSHAIIGAALRLHKQIGADRQPYDPVEPRRTDSARQRSEDQTPKPSIFALHKQHKPAGQTHRYHHIYAARYGIQRRRQADPEHNIISRPAPVLHRNVQKLPQRRQIAEGHKSIASALYRQLVHQLHAGKEEHRHKADSPAKTFPADQKDKKQTAQAGQIRDSSQSHRRTPAYAKTCGKHGIANMIVRQGPVDGRIDRPSADKIIISIKLVIPGRKGKHAPAIITCHKEKEQKKDHRLNIQFSLNSSSFHAIPSLMSVCLFPSRRPGCPGPAPAFRINRYAQIRCARRSPICLHPTCVHPSDIMSTVRYPSFRTCFTACSMASASLSRSKL